MNLVAHSLAHVLEHDRFVRRGLTRADDGDDFTRERVNRIAGGFLRARIAGVHRERAEAGRRDEARHAFGGMCAIGLLDDDAQEIDAGAQQRRQRPSHAAHPFELGHRRTVPSPSPLEFRRMMRTRAARSGSRPRLAAPNASMTSRSAASRSPTARCTRPAQYDAVAIDRGLSASRAVDSAWLASAVARSS
jgi:hypothetical protein